MVLNPRVLEAGRAGVFMGMGMWVPDGPDSILDSEKLIGRALSMSGYRILGRLFRCCLFVWFAGNFRSTSIGTAPSESI